MLNSDCCGNKKRKKISRVVKSNKADVKNNCYIILVYFIENRINIVFANSLDWHQSLKQFFINVSYHIRVASLTLMALF